MAHTVTYRSTMYDLIETLRGLCNASSNDYRLGTVDYWSDAHLQEILDRHQFPVRDEALEVYPTQISGGSVEWRDYQSRWRWFEMSDGGTARFIIKDATGATIAGTLYDTNYQSGMVTFDNDTGGTVYTVTGYAYDVYGAAADVWNQKAAYYATSIDFSTDNHNIRRSHILKQCQQMAAQYDAMSGTPVGSSNVATIYRGDQA